MSHDHSHCVEGHVHKGKATGTIEVIGGLNTYVAKAAHPNGKAVLFLHDAFGLPFINNQLLSDVYAKESGANVYLPDLFEGDAVPIEVVTEKKAFDFMKWKEGHSKEKVRPLFLAVIKDLKENHGITNIVSTGYCYGGWCSIELAATDLVDGAVMAHPSAMEVPKDIENVKKPCLFLCAEEDHSFPKASLEASKEILEKKGIPNVFEFYPGTVHGFAVRGPDDANPVVQKAAQDAKDAAVAFFKKYLNIY